jgi:uncharacterized DUF497 family protein
MRFDWDPVKNQANRRKHGIGFDDVLGVFDGGDLSLELFDDAHSAFEPRFITVGPCEVGLVVVAWTERDDLIRLISARPATPRERRSYRREMERRR